MQKNSVNVVDTSSYTTDKYGRRVFSNRQIVLAGRHLEIAINRAKRYMRKKGNLKKAPFHIEIALAAFASADTAEFMRCLLEAGYSRSDYAA